MEYKKGHLLQNRYEITGYLGRGAFSTVYKAIDLTTNEPVTVKVLFIEHDEIEEFNKRLDFFHREVTLLQRASHPNIVRIFDSGIITKQNQFFLVMEYVEGVTLDILIKKGTFKLERATHILKQIGKGLQAIHAQGIIHRDLNPNNILIFGDEPQEQVKLIDFGLAKMIRGDTEELFLKTLTSSGVIVGTIYYMSPEQCKNDTLDASTDIYSMGITAYEMLSGQPPFFDQDSCIRIFMAHMKFSPPELQGVPKNVEAVIFKALKKAPENRFSSAVEFADAFEAAVVEVPNPVASVVGVSSSINKDSEERLTPVNINKLQNTNTTRSFWKILFGWIKKK